MTEKEKYDLLLQELAEVIRSKNDEILVLKYRLKDAEEALKKAEGSNEKSERMGA